MTAGVPDRIEVFIGRNYNEDVRPVGIKGEFLLGDYGNVRTETYARMPQRVAVLLVDLGEGGQSVRLHAIPASWDSDDEDRFLGAQDCDLVTIATLQDVPEEYR